ncbi:hypothetical protein ASF60_01290 [Methylobacterium sp. Leaf113]|uniref:DUF4349 domain-containing protein n=1 Tax=Methylobacterium sp. Leaf113 TaxID=1736259 RepID=UPI0006F9C8DA|nr:DUF4349 domain-containing protein [Methylobacterium sp. Leaf113]KQP94857.1 hypothetical protein ASF60_01290 [Methylobacterium sp. Leaf113]
MNRRAALRPVPAGLRRRRLPLAALGLAALLGIGGCRDARRSDTPAGAPVSATSPAPRTAVKLAYTHELTIDLPADRVGAHFAAARDRCVTDTVLDCTLISASFGESSRPSGRPSAKLDIRLPHSAVAAYLAFVTAPLPGEQASDVILQRQATRADDLTPTIEDGVRRLAQRKAYRERLDALAAKPDTRVEDLIRIAQEIAQVQAQIEEDEAKQRGLERRVETELIALSFQADQARAGPLAPLQEAWARAGTIFGASAGAALLFAIWSLPWLPLVALAVLLLRGLWRLRRRRRGGLRRPLSEERP